ncbi:MAG: cbb3-type cytochrome c oxidase subunit II, partial [Planctomycetota bacterium]
SRAGEGIYDRPFLWGSKRTGPDLAREGSGPQSKSNAWHWAHMEDPTTMATGSTMPRYPWLYHDKIDFASLSTRLSALKSWPIYTPYTEKEVEGAADLAKAQAKIIADDLRSQIKGRQVDEDIEIIALIAYLQRLGTDLGNVGKGGG